MGFIDTGITEMASPQQMLDDLVELFHADGMDPLVRHMSAVALLKSLTVLDLEKREGLASIFVRRQSDLLALSPSTAMSFRAVQRGGTRKLLGNLSSGCAATSIRQHITHFCWATRARLRKTNQYSERAPAVWSE